MAAVHGPGGPSMASALGPGGPIVGGPSVESRRLKEELAWVIDKRLRDISNKMLFKTVVPLRN